MKTKLFLLTVFFAAFIVACNQPKKNNEKEPEATAVQKEETAEPVSVKGKIVNQETGEAISMAVIIIKGTTTATVTGPDGGFMIQVPAGAKKLVFSANGFEALEADIDSNNEMTLKLKPKK